MKRLHTTIRVGFLSLFLFVMLAVPLPTMADDSGNTEETQTFSREQLAQLLAPIALYPDELITQVLLASTYPLEIVLADRWVQQNKDLKGNDLAAALEQESWDPSVKALVNFPTVLAMLNQKLDLTTKIGDAFLEQKEDVMSMIQELRKKAADAGNLKSTGEQTVAVRNNAIIIEPADSTVVYVPAYDPYQVYGPWWYPAYPPYYFYPPPPSGVVFSFGIGVTLGLPWGYAWGGWDWYNHTVFINVNRNLGYNRYIDRTRYIRSYERRGVPVRSGTVSWQHDPGHRRGVAYKDKVTARKFGQLPARRGEARPESRGFSRPDRPAQTPRGGAISSEQRKVILPPGSAERNIRTDTKSGSRIIAPRPSRESVFTDDGTDASRARRSSERGGQSIGGGSVFRGGDSVPRRGERGDDRRR